MNSKKVIIGIAFIVIIILLPLLYTGIKKSITVNNNTSLGSSYTKDDIEKISNLEFSGYDNLSITDYRAKFASITDFPGYLELIDRIGKDSDIEAIVYSNSLANFIYNTLIPITAEDYKIWGFTSHLTYGNSVLDYEITRTITNPDSLYVKDHIVALENIRNSLQQLLFDTSIDILADPIQLNKVVAELAANYSNSNISFSLNCTYYPDMQEHTSDVSNAPLKSPLPVTKEVPPPAEKINELLFLKQSGYEDMTVDIFNQFILDSFSTNPDLSAVYADIQAYLYINGKSPSLSAEDNTFLMITLPATVLKNTAYVESLTTKNPEKDPILGSYNFYQEKNDSYYRLEYRISYHIIDDKQMTIKERDHALDSVVTEVAKYINSTDFTKICSLTEDDATTIINHMIEKNCLKNLTITLDTIKFESNMDTSHNE